MSHADSNVSDEVKDLISAIILENGFSPTSAVKYSRGSDPGDGFVSITYAVDIADGEKGLQLFVKSPRDFKQKSWVFMELYRCEISFYTTVYPTFFKFMEDKSVSGGLTSIPKCFGANMETAIFALENLKPKGFKLFNKTKYMNDAHMELILKTFARFHAVSFALKDQRRETHDTFCDASPYMYRRLQSGFEKICSRTLEDFTSKLDPTEDRDILDKYGHLGPKVEDVILNMPDHLSQYSILTKGDCWVNNMMLLYEDENEEHPKDLMLVDWQCVTRASPVHDFISLFYCGATEEAVNNYKHYLRIYHRELSARIRDLGSDPDVLYPYLVFEKEWKDCGLYGFALTVGAIKMMLRRTEDVPDLEACVNGGDVADFCNVDSNEEEWMMRIKYIARHFIKIGSV